MNSLVRGGGPAGDPDGEWARLDEVGGRDQLPLHRAMGYGVVRSNAL